ncbi:hypothetical protein GY45DRAFT_1264285, partial [Cubamyces sp. BRFM 1775]
LSPQSLLLLSRASRGIRELVSEYFKTAFDINATLGRFLPDPMSFRCLQARTGTLVSGSVALQFFDRTRYETSDLDIYVYLPFRREVGRWLLSQGFEFTPSRHQEESFEAAVLPRRQSKGFHYAMPGVAAIYTFHRHTLRASIKVQIIVAIRMPMEVILGFHSTCVMNAISYEKAYCLYPRATLEDRCSLLSWSSQGRAKRRAEGIQKYSARGFRMLTLPDWDVHTPNRSFPSITRWFGDCHAWTISLSLNGITPPPPYNVYTTPRLHDPAALTSFLMRWDPVDGAIMSFRVVKVPILRFYFVASDVAAVNYLTSLLLQKDEEDVHTVADCSIDDWK